MNLTLLLFSQPAYKVLDLQITYLLFIALGLIGLFLSYKKWSFGVVWLAITLFGFLLMRFQGITENLPGNFLAEPNFSNTVNSYISIIVGVLFNLIGIFIVSRKKTLQ